MLTVRTEEEKKSMINSLEQFKKTVPEYTAFGDNNHEGISAQITAIEQEWDEDDVYNNYPDDEDTHVRDMALDAVYWLKGSHDSDVLLVF